MKNRFLLLTFALFLSNLAINGHENDVNLSIKQEKTVLSIASYPFKKIWEHKKKFAALTIITGYAGMIYLVDRKFAATYIDYITIHDKTTYSDKIGKITHRLASLANTWFSSYYQKVHVAAEIQKNPHLFPGWGLVSEINSNRVRIYRVKN